MKHFRKYTILTWFIVIVLLFSNTEGKDLKPFGSHVTPTKVDEVSAENMVTPDRFANEFVTGQKPLVMRGVGKTLPAFTKWTDEYLKDTYGKLELRLGRMKEKYTDMPPQGDICLGRDSFKHFIETYNVEGVNKYAESELPTPLYNDVELPTPLGCGDLAKSLVQVDFWMSSGEVHSMLRKKIYNSVTCVLNGMKEFKIVDPAHDQLMYEIWRGDNHHRENTAYSLVNPLKVDFKQYPNIARVPNVEVATLEAGDCLYIPTGHWYSEHSMGEKNLAVGFLLRNLENLSGGIDLGECASKSNAVPLADADPDWKYIGQGRMSWGYYDLSHYLEIMDSFFGLRSKALKYDNVQRSLAYHFGHMPYTDLHIEDRVPKLHDWLNDAAGGDATVDVLEKLTRNQLRKLILEYIQAPAPGNTCDQEYYYFSPDQLSELFLTLSEQNNGTIHKEKFVQAYLKLGGHIKFANELWGIFGDDETEMEYANNEHHASEAVERFYLFWKEEEELTAKHTHEDPNVGISPPVDDIVDASQQDLTKDEL